MCVEWILYTKFEIFKFQEKIMGGAATNSGINYQQRIAALVLASQYSEFDLSLAFGMNKSLKINTIHFETDEPIDDLKIICEDQKLFLQIKRSLSFQTDENSDFYKTIKQFINQYISKSRDEAYLLVTSPQSSRTITQDFNKIIESIRLNDISFKDNPLNKSEQDTYTKFKDLFFLIYEEKIKSKPSENIFIDFSKKIFVSIIDIEKGRPNEQVALILLKSMNLVDPNLVWSTLITNSLEYARNRQSLSTKALKGLLNRYVLKENLNKNEDFDEMFKTKIIEKGHFSVAKEVLLIEGKDFDFEDAQKNDYLIIELYRFDDEGKIKHTFQGDKIKLNGTKEEITVLHRSATFDGMERYLLDNTELYKDNKIAIIPANDIDKAENSSVANLHRKYLQNLQDANKDIMKCLHCDKTVNRKTSILVEIDDLDSKPALGVVHPRCLRVIDRVLGLTKHPDKENTISILNEFDFKNWAKLMMKGQGLINQLRSSNLKDKLQPIAWSSEDKSNRGFDYCLKYIMRDESIPTIYMRDRGKIHRFNKDDALETKQQFDESIEKGLKENNPIGYTSKNLMFGNYNQLIEIKDTDEKILEVESIEICKYSKLLESLDNFMNFYSPICILKDKKEKSLLNFGELVPLISDPLTLENICDTWKNLELEFNIEDFELEIIESDFDFDNLMRFFFRDKMVPVIDPQFNKKGEVVKGDRLVHLQELQSSLESKEKTGTIVNNPAWKKGDLVRLELPSIKNGNYPEGILLEDELIDEEGMHVAIFRPIENGEHLKDLAYSIPTKFLSKLKS